MNSGPASIVIGRLLPQIIERHEESYKTNDHPQTAQGLWMTLQYDLWHPMSQEVGTRSRTKGRICTVGNYYPTIIIESSDPK